MLLRYKSKSYQNEKEVFADCEYIQIPELHFIKLCTQKYKINKGIYYTVDNWFYHFGVRSLVGRRIYIIAYLEYLLEHGGYDLQSKYLKFGSGGLVKSLKEFIADKDAQI